jgi:hypothetical protein
MIGKTGEYPDGKLTDDDEGGIRILCTHYKGKVVLDFGTQVIWLGFRPDDARKIAAELLKQAEAAEKEPNEDLQNSH